MPHCPILRPFLYQSYTRRLGYIVTAYFRSFVVSCTLPVNKHLRQTRYSDLDLSFTALAARTDVYKYSFFSKNNT